jgi:hypothetical protein
MLPGEKAEIEFSGDLKIQCMIYIVDKVEWIGILNCDDAENKIRFTVNHTMQGS